jgi:hypothetical protein
MKKTVFFISLVAAFVSQGRTASGQAQVLESAWLHIRNADPREWAEFAEVAQQTHLVAHFTSRPNASEQTLSLRQYDVKLTWKVFLNGTPIGNLEQDEKDLMRYLKVPPGILKADNTLDISCEDKTPDDIMVGQIALEARPLDSVLSEGNISIEVVEHDSGRPLPSRITIVNGEGILQTVSGSAADTLAIRPGCIYTGSGRAGIGVPSGTYTLYAGRGFEYGIDSAQVTVRPGDHANVRLTIRREVATPGWVSSDTHIHTFTYSRHGDASVEDRVLTIAGEGLELPIATDHNLYIDLNPFAREQGVSQYFTPVMGDELTTAVGHFNVFPVSKDEPVINPGAKSWKALSGYIGKRAKSKVIILNHARDIHLDFRPFDPKKHLASAGMRLDGWDFPANAMEIMNSGSQQTDQLQLTRDWFGMLNHGYSITPAGGSDSHDVIRYIVGQGRTYIRCNDDDPGKLNVSQAVRNFKAGNVMVSFGLLANIEINDTYGPGELAPGSDEINIAVEVSGPAWSWADKVSLYANGKKIREESIRDQRAAGVKWSGNWKLTVPTHDIFLVAVAEGPDRKLVYWPIAKPYQPVSPEWHPRVLGISGAVWIDGDRNGKRNSAWDYAQRLIAAAKGDTHAMIQSLAAYDESVATQVAAEMYREGADLRGAVVTKALQRAAPQTREGFEVVMREVGER